MRALLLAAGLGTRLKPLTNHLPKCLVPIHGRPLLDYWLELLVKNGVSEILINTHYLMPLVAEYVAHSDWVNNVTLAYEDKLLGTGGTILAHKDFFGGKAFLVAHADNLTIFDPKAFIDHHHKRPRSSEMTMMVFETPDPKSCGIVGLDQQGVVVSFHEKVSSPPGSLANAAVYILESPIINFMATLGNKEIDFSTQVIPYFMGHISTYINSSYHRDVGTIESWVEAHKDFSSIPRSSVNVNAWFKTMVARDAALDATITRLLGSTHYGIQR